MLHGPPPLIHAILHQLDYVGREYFSVRLLTIGLSSDGTPSIYPASTFSCINSTFENQTQSFSSRLFISSMTSSLKSIGPSQAVVKNASLSCLEVYFSRASRMVIKFFK